jgi:NTE family protein
VPVRIETSGLALSAGGARGAYQIGCWRALLDRGISFGAVAGSSIGALNGALICQNDWRRAHDLWCELARTPIVIPDASTIARFTATAALDVGLLLLPVPKLRSLRLLKYALTAAKFLSRHGSLGALLRYGLTNIARFRPLLEKYLDLSSVLRGPVPLFVTVFATPGIAQPLGRSHWFRLQDLAEEDAWDVLAASMAVPLVFSTVEVKGETFTDGGLGQWLPIEPLYRAGVRRIAAISNRAEVTVPQESFPGARITVIKPRKPLGRFPVATFRFTPDAVNSWIEQGYVDASRTLEDGTFRGSYGLPNP